MFAFSANSYGVGGETKAPLRMFPCDKNVYLHQLCRMRVRKCRKTAFFRNNKDLLVMKCTRIL